MGPYTWAIIILAIFGMLGGLLTTRGTVGYLIGGMIVVFSIGGIFQIAAYRDFTVPLLNRSAGFTAAMVVLLVLGLNLIFGQRRSGSTRNEASVSVRDRIPSMNVGALVAIVIGGVFVLVALSTLFGNLSFSVFDPSGRGADIAQDQFNDIGSTVFRDIERFLAR